MPCANAVIDILELEYVDISSHEIRDNIYKPHSDRVIQYIEPEVLEYIKEHGLYKE